MLLDVYNKMKNNLNQSQLETRVVSPLFKFCKHWKSQNLILVFAIILFLSILLVVYLLSYYLLNLTIKELQRSSNLIFQLEMQNQIQRYSELQLRITSNYFSSGTSELEIFNEIFHFTEKGIDVEQPTDCLFNVNTKDPYQRSCQFCYGFCNETNQTNPADYEDMLNFTSMLTEYAALFDLTRHTFFTGISDDQLLAVYDTKVPKGFQSHTRQWYLDHMTYMSNGNKMIVSDPYFSQQGTISVSQTMNLTNQHNELVGVIAKSGNFSNMPKFMSEEIVPTLVNQKGDLMISEFYLSTKNVTKFYQTNLTGFTMEDWETIIKLEQKQDAIPTTNLYNSLYDKELMFSIVDMKNPPLYLLLYINDTEYNRDQQILFAKFYEFQQSFLIMSIEICSGIVVFILIVQFISISLISKDLRKLTSMTCQRIISRGSLSDQNQIKINTFSNQTIKTLFEAYDSFIGSITTKGSENRNADCLYLELIKYPFQYPSMEKQSFVYYSQLKHQIGKINNSCFDLHKVQLMICQSINGVFKKKSH